MSRSEISMVCISAIAGFLFAAIICGAHLKRANVQRDAYAEMVSLYAKNAHMWREFAMDMCIGQLSNRLSAVESRLENLVDTDPEPVYLTPEWTNWIYRVSIKSACTETEGGVK
ncbi:MAG: hypothetical protein IJG84_10935 [Kiritimatiellae bacterium]|nr:hypothetical protein [Kiritimatiellia bacterium]